MAYLAFTQATAETTECLSGVGLGPSPAPAALSTLEWQVVGLARRDRMSTLRTPGTLRSAVRVLFGDRADPRLADSRLEALRRIAVLTWHHGYAVPSQAVRDFLAAGFSTDQYELVADRIGRDRLARDRRRFRI